MFRRFGILILTVLIAGCSSSTDLDDDNNGTPTPLNTRQGFFIDDAVQGLQYRATGGSVKLTDKYGTLTFTAGVPLEFLVDGVSLGTVGNPLVRVRPNDFGITAANIARFLQSLDTTPGEPGIDLTGVDLAGTQINFVQSRDGFSADPDVLQAVQDAANAGASGVLIDEATALAELNAGTLGIFTAADFNDVALYPTSGPNNEPCFVRFRADGTGQCVCQDDIAEDPSDAVNDFTWSINGGLVELLFGSDEKVTVQRLGTTGNRFSVDVAAELLQCNPNTQQCIEVEAQTLITALPVEFGDFADNTLVLAGPGATVTVTLNANGTGSLNDGSIETVLWSVDTTLDNILLLQGTGTAGTSLAYHEIILIEGTVDNGKFAALLGSATDTDLDGVADTNEFDANGEYDGVEEWNTVPN